MIRPGSNPSYQNVRLDQQWSDWTFGNPIWSDLEPGGWIRPTVDLASEYGPNVHNLHRSILNGKKVLKLGHEGFLCDTSGFKFKIPFSKKFPLVNSGIMWHHILPRPEQHFQFFLFPHFVIIIPPPKWLENASPTAKS